MKGVHVPAELMALTAITCSPSDEVRGYLVSKLKSGHFAYEDTHPLYVFIMERYVQTGAIPSINMLASLPGVPQKGLTAVAAYASSNQPISNADDAVHIVNQLNQYRKARIVDVNILVTQSELQQEMADFDKIKQATEKTLLGLTDSEDDAPLWHFGEGSNSEPLFERVMDTERPTGIQTGFKNFDLLSGGFRRGNFNLIASHYKGGKSMVSYRMALNMYQLGYNVLYVPLEMTDEECFQRHMSSISGIECAKINKQTWTTFEAKAAMKAYADFEAKGRSKRNRFSIQGLSTITPSMVEARYKALKYDVIVLDYLNLMELDQNSTRMSESEKLNNLGKSLKQTASRMNVVLMGLTQLDEESGKIRYSRSFYEHCNNVWEWVYKDAERQTGIINVQQRAARSWEPFPFKLKVDYQRAMVEDAIDTGFVPTNEFSGDVGMEDMFTV